LAVLVGLIDFEIKNIAYIFCIDLKLMILLLVQVLLVARPVEPLQQLACLLWYEVIEFDKGCPAYLLL